jgi:hypothetical protein
MKFIKSFKIFESRSIENVSEEEVYNMLDTVEDIFLELKDIGFKLNYSGAFVSFSITKPMVGGINFYKVDSDVFDFVVRICNYLDTIDYMRFNKIMVESKKESDFFTLEEFENYAPNKLVSKIKIVYDEIKG